MASKIYNTGIIELIDGTELYLTPLKIRYLREFMEKFENVKSASGDAEAVSALAECARVAMKQCYPSIKTIDDLEDSINLPTIYKILDIAAGIKVDANRDDEGIKEQATQSGSSWETLDLAKLESRAFLLGIWKDYEELETSLSMPELIAILESQNEADYQQKKFLAAIQGIDLDEKTGNSNANAWEEMKARVFSGGKTNDPNDITSFQGIKAQQSGFGIGMGLDYTDLTKQ